MTWRRFHLVLCLIMVVVALLRIASGNIIGAAFALVLAAVFGSVAANYPLLTRARELFRFVRKHWLGKGGG